MDADENASAAVDSARCLASDRNSSVRYVHATTGVVHWNQQSDNVNAGLLNNEAHRFTCIHAAGPAKSYETFGLSEGSRLPAAEHVHAHMCADWQGGCVTKPPWWRPTSAHELTCCAPKKFLPTRLKQAGAAGLADSQTLPQKATA